MSHFEDAFDEVCANAKVASGSYVCLMERRPFYGGPEEGGWTGQDSILVKYQYFETEEAAKAAKAAVEKLAAELTRDAKREFGEHCLREMEWLDERGLDADFLPEPDGPSEFYVCVSEGVPESVRGCRQYS